MTFVGMFESEADSWELKTSWHHYFIHSEFMPCSEIYGSILGPAYLVCVECQSKRQLVFDVVKATGVY